MVIPRKFYNVCYYGEIKQYQSGYSSYLELYFNTTNFSETINTFTSSQHQIRVVLGNYCSYFSMLFENIRGAFVKRF